MDKEVNKILKLLISDDSELITMGVELFHTRVFEEQRFIVDKFNNISNLLNKKILDTFLPKTN